MSPTYLSKILTKLVKAGLIESASRANGGYLLIEGTTLLFECSLNHGEYCLVQKVMLEVEQQMEQHLRDQKISKLVEKITMVP